MSLPTKQIFTAWTNIKMIPDCVMMGFIKIWSTLPAVWLFSQRLQITHQTISFNTQKKGDIVRNRFTEQSSEHGSIELVSQRQNYKSLSEKKRDKSFLSPLENGMDLVSFSHNKWKSHKKAIPDSWNLTKLFKSNPNYLFTIRKM